MMKVINCVYLRSFLTPFRDPIVFNCLLFPHFRPPEPVYSTVNKHCEKAPSPRHSFPADFNQSPVHSSPQPNCHLNPLPDPNARYSPLPSSQPFITLYVLFHPHPLLHSLLLNFFISFGIYQTFQTCLTLAPPLFELLFPECLFP